jgi:hypothetical protein
MTTLELCAARLAWGAELMKMTLADFTDADMLVRPAPGANHAAWQLGHLTNAEVQMVSAAGGKMPELPAGFAERFGRSKVASDDAAAFPGKAEQLATHAAVRAATIEWAKTLTPEQLDAPSPKQIRMLAPTVGQIPALVVEHAAMHVGQFQVIRRVLGKPVLF